MFLTTKPTSLGPSFYFCAYRRILSRAEETALPVMYLPYKHKDPQLNPHNPHKKMLIMMVQASGNPSARKADPGASLADHIA